MSGYDWQSLAEVLDKANPWLPQSFVTSKLMEKKGMQNEVNMAIITARAPPALTGFDYISTYMHISVRL